MEKKEIRSKKAPAAVGPYSQAIKVGESVYVSGQLPINAETGKMAVGIENQTRQALYNLCEILSTENLSAENVVKCTIFLKNIDDFSAVNQIYATFFRAPCPARSCVEVSALPKGALIEIDAIATVNCHVE